MSDDGNGYIDNVLGWNFVTNTSDPIDDNHHGTHVSGTIGAVGNNSIGVTGVNWHVQIMPLKAFNSLGQGVTSDAIEAIEYANTNGASVISNSWGGTEYSQALKEAIVASPAVVVCAAGNTPYLPEPINDIIPVYSASYDSVNIISVAATDSNDQLASFSHYGQMSVDLAAPGTNIWSTYLDGNYASMSGTSMATPHVSGVAVLVKAVNPSLTSAQIKNIILSTEDVKSSLSGKVASGGRLNVYKSLLAALPTANFTSNITSGTAPLAVKFTDTSTGVAISEWKWDFNNDKTIDSTSQNPEYIYTSPGIYTVNLTVMTNGRSDSEVKTRYITVATNATSKIGVYQNGMWYLDYNNNETWDAGTEKAYSFGATGWTSVLGDWNGDNKTEIGVYKDGLWYLDNDGSGTWNAGDRANNFGATGYAPVIGDWNGDVRAKKVCIKTVPGTWIILVKAP